MKIPPFLSIAMLSACLWSYPAVAADGEALGPRLATLEKTLKAGGDASAFWREIERTETPLIEPVPESEHEVRVTFAWEAASPSEDVNISVFGSFNEDDTPASRRLTHLTGSNVWYRSYAVDRTARFTYSLAWPAGRAPNPDAIRRQSRDGVAYELFADPKCRKSIPGVFFDETLAYSYFEGPDAANEPWLAERTGVPKGTVVHRSFQSAIMANTRDVDVYLPPGYREHGDGYPFVILFDGNSYLRSAATPVQLDNLIAEGAIPPLVAILVGRIDRDHRNRELPPNPEFAHFVAEELLPAMRHDYRLAASPCQAVIGGSSYGALAATAIAQRYPKAFGNVLSQSGSYWWHPGFTRTENDSFRQEMGWLPRTFAGGARLPLRFYLEVGRAEGSSMVLPNRFFRDLLTARGYAVDYHEFAGGHEYVNWRGGLARGLIALLGPRLPKTSSSRSRS